MDIFPNRYFITSPYTSPEAFSEDNRVLALHISCNSNSSPYIIDNVPTKTLSTFYGELSSSNFSTIYFTNGYHMYYNKLSRYSGFKANHIATSILRADYHVISSLVSTNTIFGDVLFFGSVNHSTYNYDQQNHSVPYELIEQSTRLHEIYSKLKNY